MAGIYQWRSSLSDMMVSFLNEKRITGYKYADQEKWLTRFDSYYDSYSRMNKIDRLKVDFPTGRRYVNRKTVSLVGILA